VAALQAYRSAAGRAGKAVVRVPWFHAPDLNRTLRALKVRSPDVHSKYHAGSTRVCQEALRTAGQTQAFQLAIMRRTLTLYAAPGSSTFFHTDTLRMASWETQLRGQARWMVCPGGEGSIASSCGLASIDVFDPIYERCPPFRNASCLETTLSAGESIYVGSQPH